MKKLCALLLAVILCFGLVACKPTGTDTPSTSATTTSVPATSTAEKPTDPIRVTIARPVDSDNLDPVMQDGNINIWVYTLCLETLLILSDDGSEILPGLAESYDVSTDGLTYTFHLPKDLVWNTGEPVLGEDFVWSFDRLAETTESPWNDFASNYDYSEAPDNQTFIVHVKQASPVDLPTFTLFCTVICDKSFYDSVGAEAFTKSMVGTGPYMFKEWNPGENLLLAKNPNYRHADNIKVDEINFKMVPDDNTRIMQLQAGEVDVVTFVPYNRIDEIKGMPGMKMEMFPSTEVRDIRMNPTRQPIDKIEVRQALRAAIDKQPIVDNVISGYGELGICSFLNPSIPYYTTDLVTMEGGVEVAKQLLADAGYPNGVEVNFRIPAGNTTYEQIATIVKDQWSRAGITTEIEVLESATLNAERREFKNMIQCGGWTSDILDPSQMTRYYCVHSVTFCNYTDWNDPVVQELAENALYEMDSVKRAEMYKEIQQAVYDICLFVQLYYAPYPVAMSDKITGFWQIPLGNYRFDNLAKAQ